MKIGGYTEGTLWHVDLYICNFLDFFERIYPGKGIEEKMESIDEKLLVDFAIFLKEKGLAPATAETRISLVKTFCEMQLGVYFLVINVYMYMFCNIY